MANKVNKDLLRQEYSKEWDSQHMVDYCVNKVAYIVELPNGDIVPIDQQSIKTRFCFGESGYDYDDAANMAHHAMTSQDYFKEQNMGYFRSWIEDIQKTDRYMLCICKSYIDQQKDCKLCNVRIERIVDVLEACGGSAYLEELKGKELNIRGCAERVATDEEKELILNGFKEAAKAHEKKVDSYLKRYGLSKVYSWTYWREA